MTLFKEGLEEKKREEELKENINSQKSKKAPKNKNLRITFLILGGLFLILGLISLFVKFNEITSLSEFTFDSLLTLVPGLLLVLLGYLLYTISSNWGKLLLNFGKNFIQFSTFFLSIGIVLFSFNLEVPDLINNVQPTIDSVIVETLKNENSFEAEIFNDMLAETVKFEEFHATELTQKQKDILIDAFYVDNLSDDELEILPDVLVSSIYNGLETQGEDFLNSPMPIEQTRDLFESFGSLDVAIYSMLYLTEINPNAKIYFMVPTEENLTPKENLQNIRKECLNLKKNQICEGFSYMEYDNMISFLIENQSLDFGEFNDQINEYSTLEKLENKLDEKTSFYIIAFEIFLLLFLVGIALFNFHYSKEDQKFSFKLALRDGFKILFFQFIFPVILISILFILLKIGYLFELLNTFVDSILNVLGEESMSLEITNLPIIENLSNIITFLFSIHIILILIFFIFYFLFKKNLESKTLF